MFKAMSFWDSFQPPEDISTNGHLITWLFNYTTYVNLFWFALVCIGLFGFSLIYSAKRHKKPFYTHGTERKHYFITAFIGLAVFLSVDMVIRSPTLSRVSSRKVAMIRSLLPPLPLAKMLSHVWPVSLTPNLSLMSFRSLMAAPNSSAQSMQATQ